MESVLGNGLQGGRRGLANWLVVAQRGIQTPDRNWKQGGLQSSLPVEAQGKERGRRGGPETNGLHLEEQ